MGALAPICIWIPDDDVLLKNAVEAGASLEALAKGAVQFSRGYTLQELQSRWHALLYDPDTSESASSHMFELELSASKTPLQPVGDSKGNEFFAKRKDESVRSHYYAMRKRICTEPFSNVDLSFLDGPTLDNCQDQVQIHNERPAENCIIGDPVADHFDLQNTEFDFGGHGFPQVLGVDNAAARNDEVAAHAFRGPHQHSLEGELPDGIMGGNCLYEFPEAVPHVSSNKAIESDMPHSFEHYNIHNNDSILDESNSGVQKIGLPRETSGGSLFQTANLTAKSFSEFDPVSNNSVPVCPEFGQNKSFSSPISDCTGSFNELEYSSPLPTMPIWKTMEDMSTPSALNNENLDDTKKGEGLTIMCSGIDGRQVGSSGYDDLHTDPQLEGRTCGDGLKDSRVISEGNFLEMSNSLFSFTDEVLFMDDDDEKDMMDRSCLHGLSSILLSSPTDVHQPTNTEVSSLARDLGLILPEAISTGELGAVDDRLQSGYTASDVNTRMSSSTSAPNPHSPECQNGVINCTINTEDPDIPCNDEAFVPIQALASIDSSKLHHNIEDDGSSFPLSSMEFSHNGVDNKQGINHVKDDEFLVSGVTEPQFLPEMYSNNPLPCGMTSELPHGVSLDISSRHIGSTDGEASQCASALVTPYPTSLEPNDDSAKVELGRFCTFDSSMDFLLDSSGHCSEHNDNDPQNIIIDYKQEVDVPGVMQNHLSDEHGLFEMPFSEPLVNPSTLDQEVQSLEEDNDVPHFSDIEALIFDMDLGQCNQDSYTEVSRYQYEQAKRAILRLEQGAQSYMQRAISSHRAFAILYGRRLKHYIRKREVSLGRATDDVSVDIDLAKEGRANKISRRQAIIKMEEDGSFSLKNLGKGYIVVNGKEVGTGHSIRLAPGCLIEIRSMSFIFETNQKVVKHHLANIAKKNKGSKFE